jgi:PAS domain S-box-containing protein
MNDHKKSKNQLLQELEGLRERAAGVKETEAKYRSAQKTLKESEERYRALVDSSPVGIWNINPDGTTIYLNPAMCAMLELENPEELIGRTYHDFFTPRSLETIARELGKRSRGIASNFEVAVIGRKGGRRTVLVQGSPIWSPEGGLQSRIGTFIDLTYHQQIVATLKESEEKFKAIFNKTTDGILLADIETKELFLGNSSFRRMLGYTEEDLKRLRVLDLHPPGSVAFVLKQFEKMARGELEMAEEIPVLKKDGTVFFADIGGALITLEGKTYLVGIFRDVTARQAVEKALKEERDRVQQYLDIAGVILLDIDRGQRVRLINKKGCEILGYREEEVIGLNWFDAFLPADGRKETKSAFNRVMAGEVECPEYLENTVLTRGGVERIIAWHTTLIKDKHNNITDALSSGEDITERKKAEEELKKLASVVRHSKELINLATIEGKMIFLNEAGRRMLGIDPEQVGQTSILQVIPPHLQDMVKNELLAQLSKQGAWEGELQYVNIQTGRITNVYASTFTIKDPDTDTPLYLANVSLDISDRKKMEQQLKESEERYRTIADFTYDWEQWVGPEGNFLYVSPSCERITGYVAQDFLDRPALFYEIIHPDDQQKVKTHFLDEHYSPDVEHFEFRILTKAGQERWISHFCVPVYGSSGQWLGRRASNQDFTERKQLEKQLLQSQRMEAIGTLAGGIAHDFNNILTPILMGTEMAQLRIPEGHPAQNDLHKVVQATQRAKELVQQILTFSRQGDEEKKPLRLTPLVKQVNQFIRASLPATIEIRLNLRAGSDIVLGDSIQLHQVIMNLCANAAHAMRAGGGLLEITLTNETVGAFDSTRYGLVKPGEFVKITVRDTGIGIDGRTMQKIFDPFFTTKARGEGTGMGLSVVHGIVKNLGGHITVESTPGQGTAFHVFLPGAKTRTIEENEKHEQPPLGTERILFVDDEALITEINKNMLEQLGYTIDTRNNALDALSDFQKNPARFDLVITDQTMPKMTGIELAEALLGIRPNLPIILCSGFSEQINPDTIKKTGIQAFMWKPIGRLELAQTIRKLLDQRVLSE